MNDATRDMPLEMRAATIEAVKPDARTVDVTWTTGARYDRVDWWTGERYVEELVVSEKAIRLGRLNAGAPVLDTHDRYSGVDKQLAVVDRAWIEGGKGLATLRFPKAEDDPDADRVFRKINDGIIRSLSCGYRRLRIEVDKAEKPPLWRVVDWEPFEISFVSVPADIGAQAHRSADAVRYKCEFVTPTARSAASAAARMRMRARAAGVGT